MINRYNPNDYLYISARLRAREAGLLGQQRLMRLCELGSVEEILTALCADGVLCEQAKENVEAALERYLAEGFALVRENVPDAALFAFLQYPYDCHNIKTVLKCHYRGVAPDALLIPLGSVEPQTLASLLQEVPALLPTHMREAVSVAREAYEKNGDPREIDFALDAACFADMLKSAETVPISLEIVQTRAEIVNLLSCKRLLAMHAGEAGAATLARAFVPGGITSCESLLAAYRGGQETFAELVRKSPFARVLQADGAGEAERLADDLYLQIAKRAKQSVFGVEVVIGYLMGLEYAVKNLRILLSAKAAGADLQAVKERLRESYV